jgi:hypothetical protein
MSIFGGKPWFPKRPPAPTPAARPSPTGRPYSPPPVARPSPPRPTISARSPAAARMQAMDRIENRAYARGPTNYWGERSPSTTNTFRGGRDRFGNTYSGKVDARTRAVDVRRVDRYGRVQESTWM